jgi:thiosulfate dehydrogenase
MVCPTNPRPTSRKAWRPTRRSFFKGKGVTDDEAWESYWKVENGIRMTGMPGFKEKLTEPQIWQVSVLVKNADKISPAVKAALLGSEPSASPAIPAKSTVVPPTR